MEITYYGHSCFQGLVKRKNFLINPFSTPNETANDLSKVQVDYLLHSYNHNDYVAEVTDQSKTQRLTALRSRFGNKGTKKIFNRRACGFDYCTPHRVHAVQSGGMPEGSDTARDDMKVILKKFNIDLAFSPIGNKFTKGLRNLQKAAAFVNTYKVSKQLDSFSDIATDYIKSQRIY